MGVRSRADALAFPAPFVGGNRAASEGLPRPNRLGGALDLARDCGALADAVWTLIAYGAMATQANGPCSSPSGSPPCRSSSASRVAGDSPPPTRAPRAAETAHRYGRHLTVAAVAAGLASALLAATAPSVPWAFGWVGAL